MKHLLNHINPKTISIIIFLHLLSIIFKRPTFEISSPGQNLTHGQNSNTFLDLFKILTKLTCFHSISNRIK